MKQQTFIVMLEDENRRQVAFHRSGDKKLETVTRKIITLYSNGLKSAFSFLYKEDLDKACYIAIYETPNGYNDYIERSRYGKDEFIQLLNKA